MHAAVRGVGLACVAKPYATKDLAAGRLVRLLPGWSTLLLAWDLYYPNRQQLPPAFRAFLDFSAQRCVKVRCKEVTDVLFDRTSSPRHPCDACATSSVR
ncbi:LysR substrate-binding domain-containing protein [Chelativorans sp. M5D2P16]|uniref:LysR substrate-binding domain-containing protein n=1 Tax=Chelativorans sp. M5D2P16 TaxID=3095678 RepID=UPI003A10043E